MPSYVRTTLAAGALTAVAAIVLSGCATGGPAASPAAEPDETAAHDSHSRVALTYDGGLFVLDGETLETLADLPAEGFLRVNTAGDENGHVFVTTTDGFQVLDTGLASGSPVLTDIVFPAAAAGHAVPHEGRTALFADGTGDITLFDTDAVNDTELPEVETVASEEAHHGVALELSDGTLLATIGNEEARSGVRLLDANREEVVRNEECPSVHGEGSLKDEVVVFGCQDGVLIFKDGGFVKVDSPDEFGRMGNAYVTESSSTAVMDYNSNPDSEGYLLTSLAYIDTAAETMEIVELPDAVSYTWQGVDRDAHDNVVLISSDGALYVLDESGEIVDSWDVIAPWESPTEWQEAHPALEVVGDTAYVTEPATQSIYAVDLHSGEVLAQGDLTAAPGEIAVVGEASAH
jgi:outer membrane protein assembly factor BamB